MVFIIVEEETSNLGENKSPPASLEISDLEADSIGDPSQVPTQF